MKVHAFRLKEGQELREELVKYCSQNSISAAFVITCVAGFVSVDLRMAGATPKNQDVIALEGPLELVSMVGTISVDGPHLHVSVSDRQGKVTGGHLRSGVVHTTAEVVIGEAENLKFKREIDEHTGFPELVVE